MNTAIPCEGCGCSPCRWAIPCGSRARRREEREIRQALDKGPAHGVEHEPTSAAFLQDDPLAAARTAFAGRVPAILSDATTAASAAFAAYGRAAALLREAFEAGRDSVTGHMGLCDFADVGDGREEADEVVRKLLGDPPPG